VGENKKAVIPNGGIKEPTQKSNVDANDNVRHLKTDALEIHVFLNLLGPSIVPPRVKN
jgi:hypothetical protein